MAYSGVSREEKIAQNMSGTQYRQDEKSKNNSFSAILDDGVAKIALADAPKNGGSGRPSLVRILGRYAHSRKEGTDAKEIFVSEISYLDKVPDSSSWPTDAASARRKTMRCIWPAQDPDRPHLLWRLHDKVMESKWDRSLKNGQGDRVYFNAEGVTQQLFNEVAFCGKPDAKIKNAWYPRRAHLLNVIDRSMTEWHRENKSTLLLCSKRNVWTPRGKTEELVRWTIGLGPVVYNQIWDEIVESYGFWDEYDIVLQKLGALPWYKAKHFSVEPQKTAKEGLAITDAMMKAAGAPLTDEEMGYDLIDFDKSYPVTSYRQIRGKLGYVFMKCDELLGTRLYQELDDLAESEASEAIAEDPVDDEGGEDPARPAQASGWQPAKASSQAARLAMAPQEPLFKEDPARPASRRSDPEAPPVPWNALADGSFNGTKYAGVSLLTDEEKAMVLGVNDNGSFRYVDDWPVGSGKKFKLLKNTDNGFYSPASFTHCPLSGSSFVDS